MRKPSNHNLAVGDRGPRDTGTPTTVDTFVVVEDPEEASEVPTPAEIRNDLAENLIGASVLGSRAVGAELFFPLAQKFLAFAAFVSSRFSTFYLR